MRVCVCVFARTGRGYLCPAGGIFLSVIYFSQFTVGRQTSWVEKRSRCRISEETQIVFICLKIYERIVPLLSIPCCLAVCLTHTHTHCTPPSLT